MIESMTKLFRFCESSKSPVLSFSRACSKVGFLARSSADRGDLFYVMSALNEEKHAIVAGWCGHAQLAERHRAERDQYLAAFDRAMDRVGGDRAIANGGG